MLAMMPVGRRRDTSIGQDEDDADEIERAAEEAEENAREVAEALEEIAEANKAGSE
jgi:hypothetical protein